MRDDHEFYFVDDYASIIENRKGDVTIGRSNRGTRAYRRILGVLYERPVTLIPPELRVYGILILDYMSDDCTVPEAHFTTRYEGVIEKRKHNKDMDSVARRLSTVVGRRIMLAPGMGIVQVAEGQKIEILRKADAIGNSKYRRS